MAVALRASAQQAGNLPADATTFVGRRHEESRARGYLSHSRLLTLTGVGGVGKSRLALRVAARLRRPPADGVWAVDLADVASGSLLPQTVAEVFGVGDRAVDPLQELLGYLADRQVLLVLDNCEQLRPPCAALTERLLAAAPRLQVLATSRQPLGVPGERIYVVPTLSVPDQDRPVPAVEANRYESVHLFAERAATILPEFRIDEHNSDLVVRLCRRLEGIPLAIELAAAQLRSLSLPQLVDRMNDYFGLMRSEDLAGAPRQQTLRATMDWNFDLCSAVERAVWARLSVFAGGFELPAAEDVCSDDGIAREDVCEAVMGLVDKSVLVREDAAGSVRYRLLEVVREYGREKLASAGQEQFFRRRHRDWYLRLAAVSERGWATDTELDWLVRLRAEQPNLRAAMEFSLTEPDEADAGLGIAASLANYWLASGSFAEGRHWLDRALALAPRPTVTRAKALWADARTGLLQGDTDAALPVVRECRELALALSDQRVLAYARQDLALAEMVQHRFDRASSLAEQALAGFHAVRDAYGVWYTLYLLALIDGLRGEVDRAVARGEECVALSEARSAGWSRSQGLWALATVRWRQGDPDRAGALARDSLRLKWPFKDRWGVTLCLEVIAWIAAASGQYRRAARLLGAGHTLWQSIGSSPFLLAPLASSHEWCAADVRRALGKRAFGTAFAEGASFTRDEAIECALRTD
jgi:predicted ATPase